MAAEEWTLLAPDRILQVSILRTIYSGPGSLLVRIEVTSITKGCNTDDTKLRQNKKKLSYLFVCLNLAAPLLL